VVEVAVGKNSAADRKIEEILGLKTGAFSSALRRGRTPASGRMSDCAPLRDFARQLARSRGRLSFHSIIRHAALPEDGSVPEWIEILPLGKFIGRDGRGPFTADGAAIIAATKANGLDGGLPIDFDHGTFLRDDSRAAGWIRGLRIMANKLMARVEWTPKGAAAIATKEYRFVSPVFKFTPDDPDASEGQESGRITFLKGAGLTNDPNLEMTALARRL
jgi:phage I-like protein